MSRLYHVSASFVVIGLLAFGLSACHHESPTPPLQSGKPVQATAAPAPRGFVLTAAHPDANGEQPAIVLDFSRRLAGAQSFDDQIAVTGAKGEKVGGSWTLDDNGVTLRFPFVQSDAQYTVRIKGALQSADGKSLGADLVRQVYTGPLEPAAGFASQGNVLPARDTRGLPVIAVNVKQIDVEFYRVRDNALSDFFAAYPRNGRRSAWDLDPSGDYWGRKGQPLTRIADSVYTNRFTLEGKPNERTLSYLPIQNIAELSKPGVYFAVLKRAGSLRDMFETCYFFVSDIGLHVRVYRDTALVHAASLKSGAPLPDIELNVLDTAGRSVLNAKTGADGSALLAWTPKPEQVMVAKSAGDVAMLPFNRPALDLSNFDVAGRQQAPFEVFAWSGRDIFRPGESLRIAALLRDFDGRPIKPQPLFVRLKQPDGRVASEAKLIPRDLNYFEWTHVMPEDAPTGKWSVEFRTDPAGKDAVQAFAFHLEEFLPERLKLDLDSAPARLRPGQSLPLKVDAAYLYGAPAVGNRFTAKLIVAAEQHPIDALKDTFFGDPTIDLPKEAKDIIDTKLDEHGQLQQDVPILPDTKPRAPVAAVISGSVYETGGRAVTRTLKRVVWPADALVGVRPLFDPKDGADSNAHAVFEIVRADVAGHLLAARNLVVRLMRQNREYHWLYDHDSGWHVDYTGDWQQVEARALDVEGGKAAKLDFPVEWGDYRVEITDPASGLVMRFPFFAGWSEDNENTGKEARPDKVKLALDRPHYRAGDTLKVTLTPPHPGPGVLLVEADRLLYARDIDAQNGAVFEIPVTKDFERHDVYVTALVFRGGSATERITPARAVGVVHVPIERSERKVAVKLDAPQVVRPGLPLTTTAHAPSLAGKRAYVTLSAVDVGILNITRYAVPDAFAWFFAQRGLGVDAYDLYGRIIESFDGHTAKLSYGGDMLLATLPQARRPRAHVQTIDLFNGPVVLDAHGDAQLRVDVPDFNGTLRLAALVYADDRYGSAEAQTTVRAPLVAEISTPRALAGGDRAELTLDLQNLSGKSGNAKVAVSAQGPLDVTGGAPRTLALADGAKQTLSFPIVARSGNDVAKITVHAELGDYKVDRHFELAVRPAWPQITRTAPYALEAGKPLALGADATSGLIPSSVVARLSVSALPPLPFASALAGILKYPYGCIEQTTSKAYAALLLDADTAHTLGVPALTDAERSARMQEAFGRIASMQAANGHFTFWGGDSGIETFLTPYVVEFLLDARDAGFAVPNDVLQKALVKLNEDLLAGGHPYYGYEHADHLRFADEAYSGYVLARVGRAPLGTLRALYDNDRGKSLTGLPLVHLGIALKLMGDVPRGEKAVAQGFAMKGERPWYLGDYGSELRDTALMVALTRRFGLGKPEYDAHVFDLARNLIAQQHQAQATREKYHWAFEYLSTQEQAALVRLAHALQANSSGSVNGELHIGAQTIAIPPSPIWSRALSIDELAGGAALSAHGSGPLFATLDVAGVPQQAPAPDASQVDVRRGYYTTDGKPWDGTALKEGDTLIVALSIEARQDMPDALLTDLLPGGLELENLNLTDASQWSDVVIDGIKLSERASAAEIKHEEFRDDRYVAALKLERGNAVHVFYLVRAVSPGSYVVPPPLVEDMYRPQVRGVGNSAPATLKVVEP